MIRTLPVWPIAPRPLSGELCSCWLDRVAAANGLRLSELLEPIVTITQCDAPTCLDYRIPKTVRTALAHLRTVDFCTANPRTFNLA